MASFMPKVFDQKNTFTIDHQKKITFSNNMKLFHQCPSMKARNLEIEPTSSDYQVQPFVEEPVSFNFGDDYGSKLFLDSKEEVTWNNFDTLVYVRENPKIHHKVEALKNWDDDVYTFSSVEDIIHSLFKNN